MFLALKEDWVGGTGLKNKDKLATLSYWMHFLSPCIEIKLTYISRRAIAPIVPMATRQPEHPTGRWPRQRGGQVVRQSPKKPRANLLNLRLSPTRILFCPRTCSQLWSIQNWFLEGITNIEEIYTNSILCFNFAWSNLAHCSGTLTAPLLIWNQLWSMQNWFLPTGNLTKFQSVHKSNPSQILNFSLLTMIWKTKRISVNKFLKRLKFGRLSLLVAALA